jgi:CBS domain-containing protein
MLCEEMMKRDLECLTPKDTVQTAARKMRDAKVGFLPICDPSMKVLGTLTDRDIAIRVVADGKPTATVASDVMTREVVACRPKDDIRKAEQLMGKHQKSRILCIDDTGKLVGVISLSDLAQHDGSGAQQTLREVTERETHP